MDWGRHHLCELVANIQAEKEVYLSGEKESAMSSGIEIHAEFPNKTATNDFAVEYHVEFGHDLYDINGCLVQFFVPSERGAAVMIAFIENLGGHIITVNEVEDDY